jgi:hypothetical protein
MINDESLTSNLIGKTQKNHFDKLRRKIYPPQYFGVFVMNFEK